MTSHPLYWVALQTALGIPFRKLSALISLFGTAQAVFEAPETRLKESGLFSAKQIKAILEKPYEQAKKIYYDCKAMGVDIYCPEHPSYPNSLRNIEDMPCVLYGKGRLPLLDGKPVISVVGSRKPTRYGAIVAEQITSVLAVAGVTIISGGALGIDSIAHQGALNADGVTVAVLGCGIGSSYLQSNKKLREDITRNGCLLTEYPPKTPATRYSFPARNRIIAALSLGTVVVEAGAKSGSLITADHAIEQGKDVFVLPGSVMSLDFEGSNTLISNGATPVFSGLDVLMHYEREYYADLNMEGAKALHNQHLKERLAVEKENASAYFTQKQEKTQEESPKKQSESSFFHKKVHLEAGKHLSEPALRVYNTILNAKTILLADIIAQANLPAHQVLRELTALEIEGLVEKGPAGNYTLC